MIDNKKAILLLLIISVFSIFFSLKKDFRRQESVTLKLTLFKIKERYSSAIFKSFFKNKELTCSLSVNEFNDLLTKKVDVNKLLISGKVSYWEGKDEVHIETSHINELSISETFMCRY